MSETIITKGWPGPKGKCDICNTKPAMHWFGDTSVALCGDRECAQINQAAWDKMCREMEEEEAYRKEHWEWG